MSVVVEVERKYADLVLQLHSAPQEDHNGAISAFEKWFSAQIDTKNVPGFVVKRYADKIEQLKSTLAHKDDWLRRRELILSGIQLEKEPQMDIASFALSERHNNIQQGATNIEDSVDGNHNLEDYSKVVMLSNLQNCKVTVSCCEILNISSIRQCTIEVQECKVLYANHADDSTISGRVQNQTRLHNAIACRFDLETPSIVLEDCYRLEIATKDGLKVDDFNDRTASCCSEAFRLV